MNLEYVEIFAPKHRSACQIAAYVTSMGYAIRGTLIRSVGYPLTARTLISKGISLFRGGKSVLGRFWTMELVTNRA